MRVGDIERGGPGAWEGGRCWDGGMQAPVRLALMCLCLVGCVGGQQHVLRQAVGPGPGPGCASTLDCACKNGSAAACEQLGTAATAPKTPRPNEPKPPGPGPGAYPPLGTGKDPVTNEVRATDNDTKDLCTDYYEKCVAAGGEFLPGRTKKQTRCGSCLEYCTGNGFWPAAIYTWNQVRLPCPGL